MEDKFLSVVVPVYNPGSDRIREFLSCLCCELDCICADSGYEVIVVNDASCEDIRKVLEQLETELPAVKLFSLSRNRGQQYALDYGIMKTCGACCVLMDDDQEAFVPCLSGFLDNLGNGYDLIVGRRQFRCVRRWRRVGSWFVNALVSLVIGRRVRDMGGVKVLGPRAVALFKERGGFLAALSRFRRLKIRETLIPVKVNSVSRYNAWKLFRLFVAVLTALVGLYPKTTVMER